MNAVTSVEASLPKACPSCGTRYPADALFCSLDGAPLTTSPGAIAAAAASDPYLGREILGHIEIRQLVGIGAMGRVYRAFQKGIDRDVAVKILHRELSANQTLVSRFHREAKVASRLAHPNVVHVLLVGQLPDGAMYIVMEYLDGMSLQSALAAAGGAMPLPRALHVALQLCDAAGEAHAQGIVHRDIKPENVMLVKRADDPDYVKVLDFGIARLNWGDQSMATAAGLIFGTARYISPEGAQGDKVAPAGDVYSIATMVYQMLAGRTPFEGDQAVALLVQQIHDPPPPLGSVPRAAYVPEPIAAVVMKNLAKKPEDRADNARAFGRALLEAAVESGLSAQDILARPALAPAGRGSHPSVVQMPSMQRTKQLQLEPDVAARIDAANAAAAMIAALAPAAPAPSPEAEAAAAPPDGEGGARAPTKTAYMEPHEARAPTRTEIAEPQPVAPGAATTRWSPPADFEAKLVPPAPTSSVDLTMDDQQAGIAAAPASVPAARTAPARTQIVAASRAAPPMQPTAPPAQRTAPPAQPTAPPAQRTAPPAQRTAPPMSHAPSKPPSSVDTTIAGDESPERRRSGGARSMLLVVLCFLVGAAGMAGVAFKAGLIGRGHPAQLDAVLAHANDALAHERWDSPPGDNVRDITDDGLRRWPNDARLLRVRARACDDVLAHAHAEYDEGDASGARRLAKLALELDPADQDAQRLAAQWLDAPAASSAADTALPPLAGSSSARPTLGAPAAPSAGAVRAVLDVSSARPGVAQPIDLNARVLGGGHRKVDGASFHVSGPGIPPGTDLAATEDASGYHATFTFMQPGRYDVTFTARADGAPVRSARPVTVGEPRPPPSPAAGGAPPSAAPSASAAAKWM